MSRLFCICSFLLPMFAGVAFGEGTYQRTKDGKTIVWNNDPKSGDTAAWFGDRDAEGYATKVGTLTWYTSNGAVYARYFGNVVRGKFDGMVNVHFKGRTDHAIFVDGRQTTRWAAGRAPSFRVAQQPTKPAKPERTAEAPAEGPRVQKSEVGSRKLEHAAQQPALRESRTGSIEDTRAKKLPAQQAPPAKPAATAEPASASASAVAKPEGPAEGPPTVRETENVQRPTSNSESLREQAAQQPALSESRTGPMEEPASAMAEPEAPAEGPRVVQAESAFATSANRETRAGEGSSSPAEQLRSSSRAGSPTLSSEGFPEQATPLPMEDTPSLVIQPSKEPVPTPSTSKKSEAEVKDSLQSLRPPSSLLAIPQTAASPEASPRLTKQEVINIANAKARTHGYNRTDYRRAEPQYNAAYKVWSVSYEQRTADGMEEVGEHFSVIVDDKTKGTVFMLRR
jgi:hypothetical protein